MNSTVILLILSVAASVPLRAQNDNRVHFFVDGSIGHYQSIMYGEFGVPKGIGGGIRFAGNFMIAFRSSLYTRTSDPAMEVPTSVFESTTAPDGEQHVRQRFTMLSLLYTIRDYEPVLLNIGGGYVSTSYEYVRTSALYDYRETETGKGLNGLFLGGEMEWIVARSPVSLFCDVRAGIVSGSVEFDDNRFHNIYSNDDTTIGIHFTGGMRITL